MWNRMTPDQRKSVEDEYASQRDEVNHAKRRCLEESTADGQRRWAAQVTDHAAAQARSELARKAMKDMVEDPTWTTGLTIGACGTALAPEHIDLESVPLPAAQATQREV